MTSLLANIASSDVPNVELNTSTATDANSYHATAVGMSSTQPEMDASMKTNA